MCVSSQNVEPTEALRASVFWPEFLLGLCCFSHCKSPPTAAKRWLERRQPKGKTARGKLAAVVVDKLPELLLCLRRGDKVPSCAAIASAAERHFRRSAELQSIWWATPALGGITAPTEEQKKKMSHELLVTATFVAFTRLYPGQVHTWVPEAEVSWQLRNETGAVPDVLLCSGKSTTAIECIGRYTNRSYIERKCKRLLAEESYSRVELWGVAA